MPSIRIGFSTDFNLTSEQVGIGTTLPTTRLDVRGQILSDSTVGSSGGISTLTEYQGFLHSKQGIGNTVSIAQTTKGNLNSLSGEIVISGEVTVSAGTSIGAGRLDSLTVTSSFDLPRGGSTNRPVAPEKGSTRFNQDLGQLEFYTGYEWRTVGSYDGSNRGRALTGGGSVGEIDVFNISSTGNAISFGNLLVLRTNTGSCASSTRGIFAGGYAPTVTNTIEYVTIASSGNAIDFGDATRNTWNTGASSSSTRGLFAGGFPGYQNTIDYITIATIGQALDFGDLFAGRYGVTSFASPTRSITAGQDPATSGYGNLMDFVTIASTGNAVKFGDLSEKRRYALGCSNSTRGLIGGGNNQTNTLNSIDSVTIASTGNAVYFGDLTSARYYNHSGAASNIRATFPGGSGQNTIDYVIIATAGNAIDFGDLTLNRSDRSSLSDSHGGLGGF